MRNLKRLQIALLATSCLLLPSFNSTAQNIGINPTGATPDNSALLDLSSTDKGFLITRVDTASIAAPAFGLMTLSPIDSCLYMYSGASWMSLGGVGNNCGSLVSNVSLFPCDGTVIPIVDVTSTTGKTWMDRNLGASQVATSSADVAAYGDLYQWGRCSDGHEKRTSGITYTQSTTDSPGHGDHIVNTSDWRNPQNDNLWQGITGINNPCPTGYRIPTETELNAERLTWSSIDAAGAFGSPLKLTAGGARTNTTGGFGAVGSFGYYWSSSLDNLGGGLATSKGLIFNSGFADVLASGSRGYGYSVRCIKD
jgi:uncharacterized protein (TIGR02145 family)